jgi:Calcineurin-like phosphoesterase
MEQQTKTAAAGSAASFFYNLGDVIYFNGQSTLYKTEFYEPYQYYPKLIFAIPGNHDGDTFVEKGDASDSEPSLYGFMENFCAPQALMVTPYRMTMTQPYCYWTMDAPFVTIIGLYSNVEGSLDGRGRMDQQDFLNTQMKAANPKKKLLVAVHHPPYSLDSAHGGTPDILNAIDQAVEASGRTPDAVLSGHVHNYQRFSRKVGTRKIPYVVAGAGGYANDVGSMHKLQTELTTPPVKLPYQTTVAGVELEKYEQEEPGFLRITATAKELKFEYFRVPFGGVVEAKAFDTFMA